jgi:molybdenum cofactor biosynthesis enzyme MoaA
MFSTRSKLTLARATLLQDTPVYVQFYITARCNLTCKQCNIIYANSDVREVTLDEIKGIADNFAKMGVAMVLLTGGEPFTRQDLPEIIHEFESRGVHVRMQTNGLATDERIHQVVEAGGCDISISLDSLWPGNQDDINGGFARSWHDALRAMASFTKYLPKEKSFASLGCVMQRDNLGDIEDVIRFGTEISWFSSLVPIHVTTFDKPMNFRTFDQTKRWKPFELPYVDRLIERVRAMKEEGYLLYDSDQYLDDIKRFAANTATTWRQHNDNVCDSPNLYFAVLPNGNFAPCCDHRLPSNIATYDKKFPEIYRSKVFRDEVLKITKPCSGCMYGSYPEMTIAMRYMKAKMERIKTFITSPPPKKWPVTYEQMLTIAERIRTEKRERIEIPGQLHRMTLAEGSEQEVAKLV